MSHYHAVVWIDHREARVFHFSVDDVERQVIHPDRPHKHLHHRAGAIGPGRAAEDQDFYKHVSYAVSDAGEVLVVGPGRAKLELIKHVHAHEPRLTLKIVGVETVDHPTDNQLVAHARAYFKAADRMRPQRP